MELSDREFFYVNGFNIHKITSNDNIKKILNIVKKINSNEKDIKSGYEFVTKYRGTKDLRPSVYDYDDCFLNFLIEEKIMEKIKKLKGAEYSLYHVQLRYTTSDSNIGESSYMDWHRDSFIMNNKILGRFPPPLKLMFYPNISNNPENRLKIVPNSHTIQSHQDQNYFSKYGAPINNTDDQLITNFKKEIIKSSNDECFIFNTALLHGAIKANKEGDKNFRLIYTFILKDQFEDVNENLHLDTEKQFKGLINENLHK